MSQFDIFSVAEVIALVTLWSNANVGANSIFWRDGWSSQRGKFDTVQLARPPGVLRGQVPHQLLQSRTERQIDTSVKVYIYEI
jgi:hypothetical protein